MTDSLDRLIARWHALARGEVKAILLLAAILAVLAVAYLRFPMFSWLGYDVGLGPDWDCSHPGKGEAVCVKKPAPTAPPGGG